MVSLLSVVITLDRLWTASSVILHVKTTLEETSLEPLLHYTAVSAPPNLYSGAVCVDSEDYITLSKTKLV